MNQKFAAGMRVLIRDAEWLVKRVKSADDGTALGQYELTCIGISNLVRGQEKHFLSGYEDEIRILRPEETKLVRDDSKRFVKSKLFIEALLRRTPATDTKIHIAQNAAMDVLPYQLKPAVDALEATRPRMLIADAVGIGKTLEAGILVSELIARGRGKRILVLTVKAMLEQFQKEFWNRFSIPLTRLDSEGLQRLMLRIPSGHNPFLYVDRSIVSIDTLKQGSTYRDLLRNAYWDIILIDEAHNVAERGSRSQRSQLARLLSQRSDALIMLSATPHDGRPESFASLIDMLDPTVLADHKHYTAEDFKGKGLVVRRFKGDIKSEAKNGFLERSIDTIKVKASEAENAVFRHLQGMAFQRIDANHKVGSELFKTTLTKALFSSPAACVSTVENRLKKLRAMKPSPEVANDVAVLEGFLEALRTLLAPEAFSKYLRLVEMLKGRDGGEFGWNPKDAEDRLVIFTESRLTLQFLAENLPKAFGLKAKDFVVLKGDDSDKDLMDAVEKFNQKDNPVRLMLATDVASEGLNLHRLCHRLIHFDIPWSLMTFQQRNGRVDRYGQTKQPIIRYMQTEADESLKAFGDAHILELLVQKDENAQTTIADPREFGGSKEEQELRTAAEMQGEAEAWADFDPNDPLAFLGLSMTEAETEGAPGASSEASLSVEEAIVDRQLLFPSDYDFLKAALLMRRTADEGQGRLRTEVQFDDERRQVELMPPTDLDVRLNYLPREVLPESRRFRLTDDSARIQRSIRDAASNPNSSWPELQLLWELHPVMQWMEDWVIGSFGRHSAPVIPLPDRLDENEVWVLMQGGYPNLRVYTPVHDWAAVRITPTKSELMTRKALMERLDLDRPFVNEGAEVNTDALARLLPEAVSAMRRNLAAKREAFVGRIKPVLDQKRAELGALRTKQLKLLDVDLPEGSTRARKKAEREKFIEDTFEQAEQYALGVYSLDAEPYVQVVAVFAGPLTESAHDAQKTLF